MHITAHEKLFLLNAPQVSPQLRVQCGNGIGAETIYESSCACFKTFTVIILFKHEAKKTKTI